jgi:transcriptional regulator with XRE-family HTH domain
VRSQEWDPHRFRQLLTEIQEQAGLDDTAMADMAGRSRSMVNRWRSRAENRPDYEPVARLAQELTNRHPAVRNLAQELFVATGYAPATTPSDGAPTIDPSIELPPGFDPDLLPRALVEIYGIHDTPLHVRELLANMWRVAMGESVPGMEHVMPSSRRDADGRRSTAN